MRLDLLTKRILQPFVRASLFYTNVSMVNLLSTSNHEGIAQKIAKDLYYTSFSLDNVLRNTDTQTQTELL